MGYGRDPWTPGDEPRQERPSYSRPAAHGRPAPREEPWQAPARDPYDEQPTGRGYPDQGRGYPDQGRGYPGRSRSAPSRPGEPGGPSRGAGRRGPSAEAAPSTPGRVNADLDLDEIDPKGNAQRRAAKELARRASPQGRKTLKYTSLSMAGVLAVVAGLGGYLYLHFNGNLKSTSLLPNGVTQPAEIPNQFGETAMNILLLGNAGRINAADCHLGGACGDTATSADSIMVLHLSADRSNMTVMSIPRDSIVSLPACAHTSEDLINASLVTGPACSVEAVHDVTGLTIDHFIEIDMSGVVTMSNALGGVPVCVTNNLYDSYSHIKLPKGTSVIQGTQALAWLRTRHAFLNEVYREQAQHMFLAALIRKLKDNASLSHITTLYSVADAATKALTVDQGLGSVTDLLSLAQELGKVPTNRITFMSTPTVPYSGPNHAWAQQLQFDQPAADSMFRALKDDQPYTAGSAAKPAKSTKSAAASAAASPSPSPSTQSVNIAMVRAAIENASGIQGRASDIRTGLEAQGFGAGYLSTGNASQPSSTTEVYYPYDRAQSAAAIAAALDIPSSAVHLSSNYSEVTVLVGSDWTSGTTYSGSGSSSSGSPKTAAPTAVASSPPDTSLETNGADSKSCMYVPHPEW